MFTTHTMGGQKRYLGREKALVIDTRDPISTGRIRVNSRTLGASNWIPYVMSPGFFTPPKIGDWVYIECEDGLEWAPIAHGKVINPLVDIISNPLYIYREVPTVTSWTSNGTLDSSGNPPTSFGANGFTGHAILLDDGQEVYGSGPNGNPNAGIKILSFGGNKIILSDDASNQKILIADSNNTSTPLNLNTDTGNRIVIDSVTGTINIVNESNGTYISVTNNSIAIISSGTVNVNSSGTTSITASEADVTAPNVNVMASSMVNMTTPLLAVSGLISCSGIAAGGATPVAGQAIIDGPVMATGNVSSGGDISDSIGTLSGFRTHYNAHTHISSTPGNPTSPPTPTDP